MMETNETLTTTTRDRIIQALHGMGVETNLENELDLAEQFDSVTFISAVLELEQEFGIAIPDSHLNMQFFASIDHTTEIVEQLMREQA
jgi:acyl carrier protein